MKRVTALTIAGAIFTLAGGGLFIACSAATGPSSVAPVVGSMPSETASVTVHDSLNPAADQSNLHGASSEAPSGEGFTYQSYDDFVSSVSASLTTVSWQGVYCVGGYTAAVPSPTATAFDVAFFADRANWPAYYPDDVVPSSGVPLYEASFVIGQVHETAAGNVNTAGACGRNDSPFRRPDGWTSADAAGLAILPGLARYEEAASGRDIRHAFRVTVRSTNGYVWPASHRAGSSSGALPMGARLRLKSSKNLSGHPAYIQRIFRGMQTYGLIVADNGSDMYISGAMDSRWNNDELNPAFGSLTAGDFEVVQLGWR
jgi:hypothetical protein